MLALVAAWWYIHLGLSGAGPWYAWWSGAGSDLTELAGLATGAAVLYRHLNCHQQGCRRLAFRHLTDPDTGEHLRLCGHHHPHGPVTAARVADIAARSAVRVRASSGTIGP